MESEGILKYLSDGSPVIVVGDGPPRDLGDGTTVDQVEIARLTTELVEITQIHDEKPEPQAEAGSTPTTPVTPAPATSTQKLDQLHEAGVLSDDEYEAAKARLS